MAEQQGYARFFPYERPYPNQREAMDRIAEALAGERDVLFEGAPGTGKTVAALAPALEHARREDRTVVITTNVHQQTRQFIHDARAITREEPIRAVVFRGKASMCHIDVGYQECQSLRDATRELVEAEADAAGLRERAGELLERMREGDDDAAEARQAVTDELEAVRAEIERLEDGNVCRHYYENLTREDDAFYGWLYDDVRTPDEIYDYADDRGLCGYELLKEGMDGVDLVVCNYHHLLDPTIREQFFRWLGRDPGEVVAVFDEAHNVEAAAREHASRSLTETTLEAALDELAGLDDGRAGGARNVVEAFLAGLRGAYRDAPAAREAGEEWADVTVANDDGVDDLSRGFFRAYEGPGVEADVERARRLGRDLDEEYERAYRRGESAARQECQTLQVASFLEAWLAGRDDPDRYPVCGVRRAGGEAYGRAELYTCIPRRVTADLFGEVAASVLMSATLRPFDVTERALGLSDPARMAYGLAYPGERRRTFAVDVPPLFASARDDPATQEAVGGALGDAARFTPGNTLAFFPSYAEAERYHDRLTPGGPGAGGLDPDRAYLDEPGTRAQALRERFVADDGAVLFTSLWGTLTEGVSFDGDDARTVAVVGVPYPRLSDRLSAVQDAYDRAFSDEVADAGWRYAVEIPTVRKTRQALGRVIRSPEDFGVRLLLDRRYTDADMGKYGVRDTFPEAERAELVDLDPGKLRFAMLNFYAGVDAYGGDPPDPEA